MENFLDQLLHIFVTDRLAEIYQKDKEYQRLLQEEQILYEQLCAKLSDEASEELHLYFMAACSTSARKESLTYQQGMRDLLALFKYLSKSERFLSWHSAPHYIMPVPRHALLSHGASLSHGILTKR